MGGAGRFVAEEVAVGPGVKEALVALPGFFPDGEGDGAVRKLPPNGRNDLRHPFVGEIGVLTALKDKGPEARLLPPPAAGKDFIQAQAVADGVPVAAADAAV